MADLVVMAVDKVAKDDPYMDAKLLKRGYVIEVQADGFSWGTEDRAFAGFRILCVPDLSVSEASVLLGREFDTDPTQPSRVLQCRAFRLELGHPALDAAGLRAYIDDDARAQDSAVVSADVIRAITVRVDPRVDPAVVGAGRGVIG